ncbi:hypothetical protein D9M69_666760 [compost metagenome]
MCHDNDRRTQCTKQSNSLASHTSTQTAVKIGEGFVHQQQIRLWCQCSDESDPLLLATRKHMRIAIRHRGKANQRK